MSEGRVGGVAPQLSGGVAVHAIPVFFARAFKRTGEILTTQVKPPREDFSEPNIHYRRNNVMSPFIAPVSKPLSKPLNEHSSENLSENLSEHLSGQRPDLQALKNEPININEEASVNFWVATLGCNEATLRLAVAEVGPAAQDVGNELGVAL